MQTASLNDDVQIFLFSASSFSSLLEHMLLLEGLVEDMPLFSFFGKLLL